MPRCLKVSIHCFIFAFLDSNSIDLLVEFGGKAYRSVDLNHRLQAIREMAEVDLKTKKMLFVRVLKEPSQVPEVALWALGKCVKHCLLSAVADLIFIVFR